MADVNKNINVKVNVDTNQVDKGSKSLNTFKGSTVDAKQSVGEFSKALSGIKGPAGEVVSGVTKIGQAFTAGLGPIGLVVAAITAAISIFNAFKAKAEEAAKAVSDLAGKMNDLLGITKKLNDLDAVAIQFRINQLSNLKNLTDEQKVELQNLKNIQVAQKELNGKSKEYLLIQQQNLLAAAESGHATDRQLAQLQVVKKMLDDIAQKEKEEAEAAKKSAEQREKDAKAAADDAKARAQALLEQKALERSVEDYFFELSLKGQDATTQFILLNAKLEEEYEILGELKVGTKEWLDQWKYIDGIKDRMKSLGQETEKVFKAMAAPTFIESDEEPEFVGIYTDAVADMVARTIQIQKDGGKELKDLWKAEADYHTAVNEVAYGKIGSKVKEYGEIASQALGSVAGMMEEGTTEWKAFAAAQALMDGYLGIQSIWAAGMAEIFSGTAAKVAATVALGIMTVANVAKIMSTQVPKSNLAKKSGQSSSGAVVAPTRFVQQGSNSLQSINKSVSEANQYSSEEVQASANAESQSSTKVYVTETDLRSSSSKLNVVENSLAF